MSKSEIDRLGDRIRADAIAEDDLRALDEFRRSFISAYETVVHSIREVVSLEPTGRPAKSTTAILEKLRRETVRLSQIQDIAGCRIVVPDVARQDDSIKQLVAKFPGCAVIDRRSKPSFGYRAVHLVVRCDQKPIEVQIRTEIQHGWAELSEKFSDVVDPTIKYGGGDPQISKILLETSSLISQIEDAERSLSTGGLAALLDQDSRDVVSEQKRRIAGILTNLLKSLSEED